MSQIKKEYFVSLNRNHLLRIYSLHWNWLSRWSHRTRHRTAKCDNSSGSTGIQFVKMQDDANNCNLRKCVCVFLMKCIFGVVKTVTWASNRRKANIYIISRYFISLIQNNIFSMYVQQKGSNISRVVISFKP